MDLVGGYLLVMLICFSGNIALLFGNYEINNLKLVLCSAITALVSFIVMFATSFLNVSLLEYLSYVFLIISIVLFIALILYVKKDNLRLSLVLVLLLSITSVAVLSSQADLNAFDMFLYSLFAFMAFFVVYQLSKLLHNAKRQYSVIIGEYMSLFSILVFIFALTHVSVMNLDYSMFRAFLILTPMYQLIYVIIAIFVVLIVGVVLNELKGGN